jgi:NADPH-dependent ferric siderophore reductase
MQLATVPDVAPKPTGSPGLPAEVLCAEDLGVELRRIVLAIPALDEHAWRPGDALDVLVASGQWRTYALAGLDAALGRAELVVSLASLGPGARWAACALPGERVRVRGPWNACALDLDQPRHVLVGDDTALAVAFALARARPGIEVDGILELPSWSTADVARLGLPFEVVVRRPGFPGVFAARIVDALGPADAPHHVIGESAFVARIATVLAVAGVPWRALVTWKDAP